MPCLIHGSIIKVDDTPKEHKKYTGFCVPQPEVGSCFYISENGFYLRTSRVQSVEYTDTGFILKTLNSTYVFTEDKP